MYLLRKHTGGLGTLNKPRLHLKGFRSEDGMYKFLNKQPNNDWQPYTGELTKAGIYAYAGGKWHNVKDLDATVLAHI